MGMAPLEKAGIEIMVGKAVSLDTAASTLTLESNQELQYERLVLATGSKPIIPPIPGIERDGVFAIEKSLSEINAAHQALAKLRLNIK
jgi:NAD(P)H-nitrite reductase large subunit